MLGSGKADGCADGLCSMAVIVPEVAAWIGKDQFPAGFVSA